MNLYEILTKIAIPRPNYSKALDQTAAYIKELLSSWGIPFEILKFSLRPYSTLLIGITFLILAVIFFILVVKKRPILSLIVALAFFVLLFLEFEAFRPVVTGLIRKPAEDIIVKFNVTDAEQELIFCAHYDSKTEFFSYGQRSKITPWFPKILLLGLILAIWTFFRKRSAPLGRGVPNAITIILAGTVLVFYILMALVFSGFVFLKHQSHGAVDNGAGVVTLLALSKDIHDGKVDLGNSNVTILLVPGEEILLQGSQKYVNQRYGQKAKPELPTYVVNVDSVGMDGNLCYFKKEGIVMFFFDADPTLVKKIDEAWEELTGSHITAMESETSDIRNFMIAGLPGLTLAHTGRQGEGHGFFHSPKDNMGRVNLENLKLSVKVLEKFIENYNSG